ncbi:2-aminoethylphosphonate--pyruvate transaminase [Atopomonas sediminilitoris]|uniref:2-aminoethylphosphonate--pyruvate transaminase n=1 Tax=Atopomonas sediminilitoris TaxID=2919919 RepID=UPI001F4EFE6F|nr:2-aminoethylphosphonate--pyruvate transaminase [Atopomonas sediminilitoris]MCJ8170524.1 2-aminoethylphosphonate--pyruvate transaminase [Atopomonas sediminilitoris]
MREPILLTPGPLTTTLTTKSAMLRDWGSWDERFNQMTASVCADLLAIAQAQDSHVCVPLQGSGTFAVEAAIGTLLPRDGTLLVLSNGAYGQRMAQIAEVMGRAVQTLAFADDQAADPAHLASYLAAHPEVSHVGVIHCETSTGLLNPLAELAAVTAAAGRGLIIDSMSAFAALPVDARSLPFSALIASANKCLEGVPGMGFVLVERQALANAQGNSHSLALDLYDQHAYMARTGQWRYTPPTHVLAALRSALDSFIAEGGQPARLARYQDNANTLLQGLARLGLTSYLLADRQAPIIITVHAPKLADYDFTRLYQAVRARGFILYPGKLTRVETFRIGCIGAIQRHDIEQALAALAAALTDMGWQPPAQEH